MRIYLNHKQTLVAYTNIGVNSGRLIKGDMPIFLIATTLTLLLAHEVEGEADVLGGNSVSAHFNDKPCEQNKDNNAAIKFDKKHILRELFDRSLESEWETYLKTYGLCNRPWQTFFERTDERRVQQICNGWGMPLLNSSHGNLCISNSSIPQYKVSVSGDGTCRVQQLKEFETFVVVACDKVDNQCLPVHLEKYVNQKANLKANTCSPRALPLPKVLEEY